MISTQFSVRRNCISELVPDDFGEDGSECADFMCVKSSTRHHRTEPFYDPLLAALTPVKWAFSQRRGDTTHLYEKQENRDRKQAANSSYQLYVAAFVTIRGMYCSSAALPLVTVPIASMLYSGSGKVALAELME